MKPSTTAKPYTAAQLKALAAATVNAYDRIAKQLVHDPDLSRADQGGQDLGQFISRAQAALIDLQGAIAMAQRAQANAEVARLQELLAAAQRQAGTTPAAKETKPSAVVTVRNAKQSAKETK